MPTLKSEMSDTNPEIASIQEGILRRLTGEERLALALEMSLMMRDLSATRIRQEHPDWSPAQITRELLRYAFLPNPLPAGLR